MKTRFIKYCISKKFLSFILLASLTFLLNIQNIPSAFAQSTQQVLSLTLVNSGSDQDIGPLTNGDTINLALTGTKLNIRANTSPSTVGSVVFGYDTNPTYQIENNPVYAFAGNSGNNYHDWTPSLGSHTVTATPYTSSGGGGTAGTPLSVTFNVINGPTPTPPPDPNTEPTPTPTPQAPTATPTPVPTHSITGIVYEDINNNGVQDASESGQANIQVDILNTTHTTQTDANGNYQFTQVDEGLHDVKITLPAGYAVTTPNPQTVALTQNTSVNFGIKESTATINGTLKKWHPVIIDFEGPSHSETDNNPNPFLDYRLQVTFTSPTGNTYSVPGYFDGDGNGNGTGNIWRVKFAPDEEGDWTYLASFRQGTQIAISLDPNEGTPTVFDSITGSFTISPTDINAPGFLKYGLLEYANGHYLKHREGPYFIKGGTDSPEGFFGYSGFDNTHPGPYGLRTYTNHISDWQQGDPDWGNEDGKGIIGALNYLSSVNANSIYFLTMNIGGDTLDTWPFVGPIDQNGDPSNDNLHYDVSKLAQWEIVMDHAQKKNILLHFVLGEGETDNKIELDNATLGTERKLYYRELVARFGHHNAIQWNLMEEYDGGGGINIGVENIKDFAQYIQDVDPYNHPITVHNWADPDTAWTPLLGDTRFSATSFQYYRSLAGKGAETEEWRTKTQNAGRPLPINLDEFEPTTTSNINSQRKNIIWPNYLSGGNLEYILAGPGAAEKTVEDFREYEQHWNYSWYARKFLLENLPFWEMNPNDSLLSGEAGGIGHVFEKPGEVYAIYLPDSNPSGTLDLTGIHGTFTKRWYNPRTGEFVGSQSTIEGNSIINVGTPPSDINEDWTILIELDGNSPTPTPTPSGPTPTPTAVPTPTPTPNSPTPTPTPSSGVTLLNYTLSASENDADEDTDGTVRTTASSSIAPTDNENEWMAFRWEGVEIPSGATITRAWMTLNLPSSRADEPQHPIIGQLDTNPVAFAATTSNISSRLRTSSSILWDNPDLQAPGDFETPDLSPVIQEIVDQTGWQSGNPIVLMIRGGSDSGRDLTVRMFDHGSNPPQLHVEYVTSNTPSPTPTATPIPPTATPTPTPLPTHTLTGTVYLDANQNGVQDAGEVPQQDITVELSTTQSQITDTQGSYTFAQLQEGSYTVSVIEPIGYIVTTQDDVLISLTQDTTVNFGIAPAPTATPTPTSAPPASPTPTPTPVPTYNLTGIVYIDSNSNGVQDAGEAGFNQADLTLTSQTTQNSSTDTTGYYEFNNLSQDTYTLDLLTPQGYTTTTTDPVIIALTQNTTVNFGIIQAPTATPTPTSTPTPTPAGDQVLSLTLVNSGSDQDIGPLTNGDTINLALTGTKLNIRANTSPSTVGSVVFGYDTNPTYQIENNPVYAFAGNSGSNYHDWTPSLGSHTVTATPYTSSGGGGTAGTPLSVTFTVINQ